MIDNTLVTGPHEIEYAYHVYHLYVIQVESRGVFRNYLQEHGISTLIHYPVPIHRQKFFVELTDNVESFPVADRLSKNILSLPLNPYLNYKEIDFIIDRVNNFTG